jgi:hypothetical protein
MPENVERTRPDSGNPAEAEAISFDDLPLHRQLLTDGERWRAGLPSPTALVREAERLTRTHTHTGTSRAATMETRRTTWEHGHTARGQLSMQLGRIRTFAGAAMAVAVVALFALLLHGFVVGRTSTGTGSGSAPTSGWQNSKGLGYTTTQQGASALPAFAPSDPSTVYIATVTPSNPPALRRTTNGGATWTNVTLPCDSSNVDSLQVFLTLRTGRGPAGARFTPAANATSPRRRCPRHG